MSDSNRFPASPFWDYSLVLYARPGVADACRSLQDEYGLDVNLLLFCVWFGTEAAGHLDSADIGEALGRTRDWQARVVQPLRAVRRFCARNTGEPGVELRSLMKSAVQDVELDAEHVEQLVLTDIVAGRVLEEHSAADATDHVVHNLSLYLASQQVDLSEPVAGHLQVIIAAAVPSAPQDAVAKLLFAG